MAKTLSPVVPPVDVCALESVALLALISGVCGGLDTARALVEFGAVYVNGDRAEGSRQLSRQHIARVHRTPRRFPIPADWKARTIAQGTEWLVVDKPSGLPIHPTCDNAVENLQRQLELFWDTRLWVCHRLDIGTSGLVVFAKTVEFCRHFATELTKGAITKRYRAMVQAPVTLGLYQHYQPRRARSPFWVQAEATDLARECRMEVLGCQKIDAENYSVEMELLTGRQHQLRAQLAFLGAPIVGDLLYGSKVPLDCVGDGEAIQLRAFMVGFTDRSGQSHQIVV